MAGLNSGGRSVDLPNDSADSRQTTTLAPIKISILVPAHNEAAVIATTVRQLMQLDYPDYELLVIDDRSTDDTPEILHNLKKELSSRFQFYTRTAQSVPGKAAALNESLEHVNGEILVVFDADAQVDSDFLKKAVAFFSASGVGAVQTRKVLLNSKQNWLTECQQYEYCMDAYFQNRRDTTCGSVELRGNGMLIKREVIELLGFNERSLSEDLDLCTRMHIAGWDIRYAPSIPVREEGLARLGPLIRQRLRWTEGSIIRYLENAENVLFNANVAYRTRLDLLMFVFEFFAPLWLSLENCILLTKCLTGTLTGTPAFFSSTAMLIVTIYFLYGTYRGVADYDDKPSFSNSIRGAVMVYLYFSLLWPPIVACLLTRILLRKERNLHWVKTQRQGVLLK